MRFLKLALVFILLFAFAKIHCQSSSIEVLSWNVFLRPSVMNDGQMNRVDEIADYLKNSGADILVLQEVFHGKARRNLKKQLNKIYPYQTKKGPVSWVGIPSGVVFFSKMPILSEKRISFSFAKGADRLAKKGAIIATFEKNGQRISIIGTHLQAGKEKSASKIRDSQLHEISKAVHEVDSTSVLIYAGDFNIRKEGRMFSLLKEKLNFKNPRLLEESTIKATANFSDHDLYKGKGKPSWIDFILVRKSSKVEQKALWIEEPRGKKKRKNKRLSDHNPIVSIVEYENK